VLERAHMLQHCNYLLDMADFGTRVHMFKR
jgi:hypothetical protein